MKPDRLESLSGDAHRLSGFSRLAVRRPYVHRDKM
jgi:hypothetical protein